jgi:hypothetical protein
MTIITKRPASGELIHATVYTLTLKEASAHALQQAHLTPVREQQMLAALVKVSESNFGTQHLVVEQRTD